MLAARDPAPDASVVAPVDTFWVNDASGVLVAASVAFFPVLKFRRKAFQMWCQPTLPLQPVVDRQHLRVRLSISAPLRQKWTHEIQSFQ
jgi:hypothetical protein